MSQSGAGADRPGLILWGADPIPTPGGGTGAPLTLGRLIELAKQHPRILEALARITAEYVGWLEAAEAGLADGDPAVIRRIIAGQESVMAYVADWRAAQIAKLYAPMGYARPKAKAPRDPGVCAHCEGHTFAVYNGAVKWMRGTPLCERHYKQATREPRLWVPPNDGRPRDSRGWLIEKPPDE